MTRRTFLRVLGSTLISSSVVRSIPMPLFPSPSEPVVPLSRWADGVSEPITPEMMRKTFERLAGDNGYLPNTLIVGHRVFQTMARELGLVFDLEVDNG